MASRNMHKSLPQSPGARVHYGWIVAAVTFFVLLIGAGVRATPSILIQPLEHEFGWSRATISFAVAINILLYGLIGPFAVAIMERFGLRRTVCAALLLLATGVALTIFMRHPWQLVLLWGVVVGAGTGVVALVLGATVAERWFLQHRGLVLGILTASSATGQLVFLPLLAWLDTHFGWRAISMTVAAISLALTVPVALLLRDRPSDLNLPPFGGSRIEPYVAPSENPAVRALKALREGLGSRDFWLLSASFFICGASTNGLIGTHLVPACGDHGIPEIRAAGLLAMMGIFDFFGTTGSGWLTDRVDSRLLLFTYYSLRGVSLFYLPFSFDKSVFGLPLFAAFYGLDWIATVPPTVRLAEQSFGKSNAALMFGWIAAVHQIGGAFAAWGAGLIRTETASYLSAFIAAGVLCLCAAGMVLFIGSGAERKSAIAEAPTL
ncbi:MAG TPA: MFS transporter [Methylovirgula sp.]|jgi:predicted MFS family arabinose efflux permease